MDTISVYVFVLTSVFFEKEKEKTVDAKIFVLEKEINVLIEKFEDEHFAVRQQAYEKLVKIVQEDENRTLFSFFKKTAAGKKFETACRISAAAEHYYIVLPDNYPAVPWIDMLPKDFPDKDNIIRKYMDKSPDFPWSSSDYPKYRYAMMLYIFDLVEGGMPRSKIVHLLNQMVENEKKWKEEHYKSE